MTTKRLAVLAAVLAGLAANHASAQTPDAPIDMTAPIATVNGTAITQADFYHQLKIYRPQSNPMGGQSPDSAGEAVLRQMIQTQLVEQLAKADGVFPTQADVDQEFRDMGLQNDRDSTKVIDDQLTAAGLTVDQFKRDQITPQLCQLNEVTRGITVTDSEITLYYTLHKSDQFTWPAAAHIKRIQTAKLADAQAAAAKLETGAPWDDVYSASSTDRTIANGDFPQWIAMDMDNPQAKPLLDAIKATAAGKFSKPFKFASGYWVIQVVAKRPGSAIPLDAVKSTIRDQLLQQKVQSSRTKIEEYQSKMQNAAKSATIVVSEPQYQALVDQIKNPPPPAEEPVEDTPAPVIKPAAKAKPKPVKPAKHKPAH